MKHKKTNVDTIDMCIKRKQNTQVQREIKRKKSEKRMSERSEKKKDVKKESGREKNYKSVRDREI